MTRLPGADGARRYDIESLRAVAVVSVMVFHHFPKWFPGGFIGVDVFFVISGYVVTLSVVRQLAAGSFRLGAFYERRIRRLFPALAVVSLACLVGSWAFDFNYEFKELGRDLLLTSLFSLNFRLTSGPGYFEAESAASPLLHFWSLAVEEQFYVIWPLMMVGLSRARANRRAFAVAIGFVASFLLHIAVTPRWPQFAFYMLPTRAWEFLAGAALAMFPALASRLRIEGSVVGSVTGLALIVAPVLGAGNGSAYPAWSALMPVIGTALLIATAHSRVNARLAGSRPLLWMGARSYSLYLWHWPPLVFHRLWVGIEPDAAASFLLLAFTLVASHLTYVFVERPFRLDPSRRRDVWTQRSARAIPFLVSVSLAIGGAGALAWQGRVPERLSALRPMQKARWDWVKPEDDLVLPGTVEETLVVFGDSYAQQYIPRFEQLVADGAAPRLRVRAFTREGCAPVPIVNRLSDRKCLPFASEGFEISARPEVRRVLIAGSWLGFLERGDYFDPSTGRIVDPGSPEGAYLWSALEARVRDLVTKGKRVYLLLNPPGGAKAGPAWVLRHFTGGPLFLEVAEHRERTGAINAALSALAARSGATVLDPQTWLCDRLRCPVTTATGEPLYMDPTHLRVSYVRKSVTALDGLVEP